MFFLSINTDEEKRKLDVLLIKKRRPWTNLLAKMLTQCLTSTGMNKVGYNKAIGLIFLPIALFILIAGLEFGSISAITGIILTVMSIGYLSAPAVTYNERQIELKNMLGMTVKKYVFGADEIAVKGGKIIVNGRKFKVQRSFCVTSQYDAMIEFIRERSSGAGKVRTKTNEKVIDDGVDDHHMEVF